MRINTINQYGNRCFISVTFCSESEERGFLKRLIGEFYEVLPVNCMLTDLDTIYSMYKGYFPRGNYCVFDHLTSATIYAFNLNNDEIENVISNWGYYTLDATLALGTFEPELKKQKVDCIQELKHIPIVVVQVLDYSLNIDLEKCKLEKVLKLLTIM